MNGIDHIAARTVHSRRDAPANAFAYSIDYVLLDAEGPVEAPVFFGRNRARPMALHDTDHGGPPRAGRGAAWVRERLAERGLDRIAHRIELLAQPRVLGHAFNPVSFWLVRDRRDDLRVVIAEVTNTYGDRHCYLCRRDDLAAITPRDRLVARKVLHVSPFQDVTGEYAFRFDIGEERVAIAIDYRVEGGGGLHATLGGARRRMTNRTIVMSTLRRPFGPRRVLALIHWQALLLWRKGARFRSRPDPGKSDLSGPDVAARGRLTTVHGTKLAERR
ncbi:DUF1365 domain-containing protein [Palleronia sp. LCG004]|uniref:DUF1365 domain-containing protein n=1 Tax=Palleronia sp. LCG004 TaxID=3079304 RepID=UPI002943BA1E|nr:DUF1365 domain-containing protein [Palleronia sp. LCG004]WOI55432.1 DUF1365 domain-containing protein [Palleronia sp. LCG004]